ncbi:hypothetical protein M1466_01490, partial [Candidatus Dependentiae bacterium]|nr:hypothetical protein [Candidatus Dependentiae bacterium]
YKHKFKIEENKAYLASLQQQAEAQRQEADSFIAQMLQEQEKAAPKKQAQPAQHQQAAAHVA